MIRKQIMAKVKFNHEVENMWDACGINAEEFRQKGEKIFSKADEIFNKEASALSEVVELLQKEFSKRELAFMLTKEISEQITPVNPLDELLSELQQLRG